MATLYFSNTSTDWSLITSWFTTLSSGGVFSGPAGRIPNSSDTAIICGTVSFISGAFTAPAVLQLGSTIYPYSGFWNGDNFMNPVHINFNFPLVNLISNGTFSLFWAAQGSPLDAIPNTYTITTCNVYGYNSIEGTFVIGTANFYNFSSNGGGDDSGTITGNVNFYNSSSNYSDGNNNSYITGNVVFNDSSSNAGSGNAGHITGTATFNGNSSTANSGNFGSVQGPAIFTSTASVQNTLAGILVDATVYVNIPSGGISKANVLLTQLLKLPFPIIV
jgi:hypothetical protein